MTTATNKGSNGFFSVLETVAGDLLGSAAEGLKNVLPVWTAKQLDSQLTDQLYAPTYMSPNNTQPALYQQPTTNAPVQRAGLLFDNVNIDGSTILIGGAVILGLIVLVKTAR